MIIDCVSDLHGFYPELEGGDLLIVAGDLTARDTQEELDKFDEWFVNQPYKKRIFIGGNHDNLLEDEKTRKYLMRYDEFSYERCEYLCDSGTEIECWQGGNPISLKVWGSPWTKTFEGMNPKCKAFTCETDDELAEKWDLIPHDVDILITHSPAYSILDQVKHNYYSGLVGNIEPDPKLESVGSKSLFNWLKYGGRPKLHVFGHIHEAYGHCEIFPTYDMKMMQSVNASHVNERYQPVNKPIRVIL